MQMILPKREKFTHSGSSEVERQIRIIVGEVADVVSHTLLSENFHALVLIGGYGRGEGGVRCDEGYEAPNNNLDFLLITNHLNPVLENRWQHMIDQKLESIQQRYQIGIDLSMISGTALHRSPSRIMWYDMRGGHKTILGNADFVNSMKHFQIDRIPVWDAHNLLVNRGTLLVINDCLPTDDNTVETQRLKIRHQVKAVIGYGDAILYSYGLYHWSYAEKQRRMRSLSQVSSSFRELYDQAMEYRFRPRNDTLQEMLASTEFVRQQCESVHLDFESRRLGIRLTNWNNYLELALRAGSREDTKSFLGLLRSLRTISRNRSQSLGQSVGARIGQRLLTTQRELGLVFPAVMYPDCSAEFRAKTAQLLNVSHSHPDQLRVAFLRNWGDQIDRNFDRFLDRCNISLAPMEPAI
jgi:hypothetical protein